MPRIHRGGDRVYIREKACDVKGFITSPHRRRDPGVYRHSSAGMVAFVIPVALFYMAKAFV